MSLWLLEENRIHQGIYHSVSFFLNAFPKHFLFVVAVDKLLDWLNPMVTFTKFKNSNRKTVQDSSLCLAGTIRPIFIPLMLLLTQRG